jgi:hypothetical protein
MTEPQKGVTKAEQDAAKQGDKSGEGGSLGVAKTQAQIDKSNAEDVARTQAEAAGEA